MTQEQRNKCGQENEYVKERVELHCHTGFSRMDSVISARGMLELLAEYGMTGAAITDFNTVAGFAEMQNMNTRRKDEHACKIIYGMEMRVTEDRPEFHSYFGKKHHVMVLIKNEAGLKDVYHLVSKGNLHKEDGEPVFYMSELVACRENLLLGCSCENSLIQLLYKYGIVGEELERIANTYDYLEVEPGVIRILLPAYNEKIISLGEKLNIPVVAVSAAHFLRPENSLSYHILQQKAKQERVREGIGKEIEEEREGYEEGYIESYFYTTEEMMAVFYYLGEKKAYEIVVENTNRIADCIEDIQPIAEHSLKMSAKPEDDERLERLCREGLGRKYGQSEETETESLQNKEKYMQASERMKMELELVKEYGYSNYFLYFYDLIHNNHLHPSQYGLRGSGASSILCYLLDISHSDPLREDIPLYHEFLMGFLGNRQPDLDINIDEEVWEQVRKSVPNLKGVKDCYRATSTGWVTESTAERWVSEYEEVHGELSDVQREQIVNDCRNIVRMNDNFHPGGVVLIPEGIDETDYVPLNMDDRRGESYLLYDYHSIDHLFEKLDILKHANCTLNSIMYKETGYYPTESDLDDLFKIQEDNGEIPDSLHQLDEEERILTMLESIPGYKSDFMIHLIWKLRPLCRADLIRLECISHGTGTWIENGEDRCDLEGAELPDLITNREDVFEEMMEYGMDAKLAYDIAEFVRKGKMNRIQTRRDKIIEIMQEFGVPDNYIDSCCKICYLFPRAHAAEYVQMELRALYYKLHYPDLYGKVFAEVYAD